MTDRNRFQLLEYLEEIRALPRNHKVLKLSTDEIAYLVALCNADVFGRLPTPGKGESTGTSKASQLTVDGGALSGSLRRPTEEGV